MKLFEVHITVNANDTYIFNTYKLLQTIHIVLTNTRYPVIIGYKTKQCEKQGQTIGN